METQPGSRYVKERAGNRTALLSHHPDGADAEIRGEGPAMSELNSNQSNH